MGLLVIQGQLEFSFMSLKMQTLVPTLEGKEELRFDL